MPVRIIPKNHLFITGLFASSKNNRMVAYEGPLERALMVLAEFNWYVAKFEEQPVRIFYINKGDKTHPYVPDLLATYRDDVAESMRAKQILFEVKERGILFKNLSELRPKFRAGRAYAREQKSCRFKIITEREIRTPYLNNAEFLLQYRDMPPNQAHTDLLLDAMRELRDSEPDALLLTLSGDPAMRLQLLPSLWQLVANRVIGADLTHPLTMRTPIRLMGPDEKGVNQCPVFCC